MADPLLMNQSDLAALVGVSRTAVAKWGLTAHKGRGRQKLYSVQEGVKRRVDNLMQMIEDQGEALTQARIRLETARAEKTELEVEQLKGSLIPADIVGRVWSDFGGRIRSKLMAIPSRYKSIVAATDDVPECEGLLRKIVEEPLEEIQEIDIAAYIDELDVVDGYSPPGPGENATAAAS